MVCTQGRKIYKGPRGGRYIKSKVRTVTPFDTN